MQPSAWAPDAHRQLQRTCTGTCEQGCREGGSGCSTEPAAAHAQGTCEEGCGEDGCSCCALRSLRAAREAGHAGQGVLHGAGQAIVQPLSPHHVLLPRAMVASPAGWEQLWPGCALPALLACAAVSCELARLSHVVVSGAGLRIAQEPSLG